jgi:hypothetical protein
VLIKSDFSFDKAFGSDTIEEKYANIMMGYRKNIRKKAKILNDTTIIIEEDSLIKKEEEKHKESSSKLTQAIKKGI